MISRDFQYLPYHLPREPQNFVSARQRSQTAANKKTACACANRPVSEADSSAILRTANGRAGAIGVRVNIIPSVFAEETFHDMFSLHSFPFFVKRFRGQNLSPSPFHLLSPFLAIHRRSPIAPSSSFVADPIGLSRSPNRCQSPSPVPSPQPCPALSPSPEGARTENFIRTRRFPQDSPPP